MREVEDVDWWERVSRESRGLVTEFRIVDGVSGLDEELTTVSQSGSVTLDATAKTRGRCDLEIGVPLDLVPTDYDDLLAPFGNEIAVRQGFRDWSGTEDLVGLGVFPLNSSYVADSGGMLTMQVSSYDRSVRVSDARLEEPVIVADGSNAVDTIEELLLGGVPWLDLDFPVSGLETKQLVAEEGADRWDFAQEIARSVGMDLYFDGDGVCVLRASSRSGDVLDVLEGDGGRLTSAKAGWSRDGVYNRVIAAGEAKEDAYVPRGVATDEDPLSPTYYFGKFGKKPGFFKSPFIASDDAAAAAAATRLSKLKGLARQVEFGSFPDPRLEPDDGVRLERERLGLTGVHYLNSITFPVGPGEMTGVTRLTDAEDLS